MPSITFWNHLEPTPRARDMVQGLAAEVRDPLWMLTRQWQFGEFWGEDAGSPAFAVVEFDRCRLERWSGADSVSHDIATGRSLEQQMLGEPVSGVDLLTRVELGQSFEHLLLERRIDLAPVGVEELIKRFRARFDLNRDAIHEADRTRDAKEFLALCGGRCVDGYRLWQALETDVSRVDVTVDESRLEVVREVQVRFVAWVKEVFGKLGEADPPTWVPRELDHRGGLQTTPLEGTRIQFAVRPGLQGEIEAYSLDLESTTGTLPYRATDRYEVMPGHLRVKGMPNARFWDFESEPLDWGAVEAEPRDLSRLAFLELMLTQGNDWFLIPMTVPVGTVSRIRSLRVTDVFGITIDVPRAETLDTSTTRRWRMFGHASGPEADPGWRVVLPESTRAMVSGPPFEEVCFLRDEIANLAWALERTHADAFGGPVTARDALAIGAAEQPPTSPLPAAPRTEGEPRLSYQLQTEVPAHWVPWIAVRVTTTVGDVELELARFGVGAPPLRTRILEPQITGPYRMPEYVIPKSGLRVVREFVKVREPDGTSRLWVRRHRRPGQGEGDSGLQYDLVKDR